MDNQTVQLGIALLCVAAAGAWLIRRTVRFVRRKSSAACGSCSQCPPDETRSVKEKPLVSLEAPRDDERRVARP